MPIVSVKIARGRTVDQKRALVDAVTKAVVSTLDVKPEWVTVLIEEFERENWATGGVLHSEKFGPGHGRPRAPGVRPSHRSHGRWQIRMEGAGHVAPRVFG